MYPQESEPDASQDGVNTSQCFSVCFKRPRFVPLFANFRLSRDGEENHKSPPLQWAKHIESTIQCFRNVVLLPENLGFRHPLRFPQSIPANPTYTFHDDHEHLPQVFRRSSLSIAQYGFSVNPHTRREYRPHPLFFIPSFHLLSFTVIAQENTVFGTANECIRRFLISATDFIRPVVLPEVLQNVRPRSLGFVIHSVVMPRSPCHIFPQAFSSSPRPGIDKLWFIVARFNHHICIHEPTTCSMLRASGCVGLRKSVETRTGGGPVDSGTFLKASATKHVYPWYGRTQRRPQTRPQFATHTACTAKFHMQTSLIVDDSIDTLIDVLNTQAFAEDQIKDTREHAHTCNFGRHNRAHFQRDCNFTNRHPSFPVNPI